ncbi:HlyD family type I secretion periplasmic adaptor subunit [Magnetospirillum sp. UT-4]|uniref:HlyD family type I secretion periplasmic adaptor subunit n=1 Tax=Magnetospirillum sp. UT-4 TaxID=2681467 RepID=UPI00137FDAFB|nr:HlyD family type I secretion periplasmic adaptor subunit [Magnetospirillum sp. UT-4]CAA7614224.1 Multidrug resistance efflux pump membrane-fusion protein [Magnetospirillum sp. UT-4]
MNAPVPETPGPEPQVPVPVPPPPLPALVLQRLRGALAKGSAALRGALAKGSAALRGALAKGSAALRGGLAKAALLLRWLGPQDIGAPEDSSPMARVRFYALLARRGVREFTFWLVPGLAPLAPQPVADVPQHRLQALGQSYPLPTWRPLGRAVMVAVTLSIAWAFFARLDEVAIAEGEVVPEGKVKVIQHLEGGVVREITTSDGAVVKEGDPLLQLELSASSVNRDELQVRLDGLMLQRARLIAEVSGTEVAFPKEEAARQPTLVSAESRNFQSRRGALKATIAVMNDQARQKALEVAELQTRERAVANNLRLARERLAMSSELMKSGLTARMDHVQLQGQVEELDGQLDSVRASIPRAQAAQAEARSRIEEEQARFVRGAQGELAEAELNIARTRELLSQASDQQRRTLITSPIDGIVKNLRANTIGGVVRPGDPIMEIVPLHERLQIDTKLSPMDRGYVQVGQKAMVKLSAYDYTTYGGLEGEVILVAPDTTTGAEEQPFYRVVVQTDRAYLGDEDSKRIITAGMQATVEIHTGQRTVMEYLIKPVVKLRHEAFRER